MPDLAVRTPTDDPALIPTDWVPTLQVLAPPASTPDVRLTRPAVLLVSRDRREVAFLSQALARHGVTTVATAVEEQALRLYGERRAEIVLVLLASGQAGLSPARVLARLRSLCPEVRYCTILGPGRPPRVGEPYLRRPLDAADVPRMLRHRRR